MLVWNLEVQKRLGCFGLLMEVVQVLRSEKDIQTRGQLMARLHHVDLFVEMRVADRKIKEII
jgi:hypothetical protein